jgi:HK97 gp10 family phage protein
MSIKIKGLDNLTKDLRKFGQDATKVVKRNLSDSGTNIELAAKARAPAYLGGAEILSTFRNKRGTQKTLNLKQRIDKVITQGGLNVKVTVQGTQDLDAYIEFGTGLNASEILSKPEYSQEIRDLAWTFKKERDGTLKGTPYLFPSYFEETPRLIESLKSELDRLAKGV